MVITKTHLDRRTFLRGDGSHRRAAAARRDDSGGHRARRHRRPPRAAPGVRLLSARRNHGCVDAGHRRPAHHAPTDSRTACTVREPADGSQRSREPACPWPGACDHAWNVAVGHVPRNDGELGHGITADQIAADHLGCDTRLSSIELATEEPRTSATGAWAGDYGEGYGATISFRAASAPLAMEVSPRRLFDRLFARGSTADTTATRGAKPQERARSRRGGCRRAAATPRGAGPGHAPRLPGHHSRRGAPDRAGRGARGSRALSRGRRRRRRSASARR